MFKKMLLSAAFALSTLAIAQVKLDMELTISQEETQQQATGSVLINPNEVNSIIFNGLESLVIEIIAQPVNDNIIMQARFFQKMEDEELLPIIDWLGVQVPEGEPGTFTINEAEGNGVLTLVVTPSIVK